MSESLFAQERRGAREGSGETLVLLHGFGGDHTAWFSIVQRLPKEWRVLSYDLPGHGRSLNVPGAGRAGAMAKAVLADLEARGIERFRLAGHSMGGAVATMMAMRAPERIAALTLLAPGGYGPEIAIDVLRDWGAAATRPSIAKALARMTAPGHRFGAFEIGRVEAMRRRPGQVPVLREIAASMADENGHQGAFPSEHLAKLPGGSTLVWGDADPILPFEQAERAPDNLVRVDLPAAGHMLMEERPAEVANAIRSTSTT